MKINKMAGPFLCVMLSGCCTPAGFYESDIDTPEVWKTTRDLNLSAPVVVDDCAKVEQIWWHHFGDPILDKLITVALLNNKNLGIAQTRIMEARAARLSAWSVLFPQVSITGDAVRGNQGFYTAGVPLTYQDIYSQASWEIDLFGKNQALVDAANALVQNEQYLRQGVIVGLLAELGRNYFDLRNYEQQLKITESNLQTQKRTLELTKDQLEGGLSSNFDVQRAAAQVSITAARLPTLKIAYEMAANRIDVLLGSVPGENEDLYKQKEPLRPLDSQIIVAAPATVLMTRPDVRAAERRFAASVADYISAKREWFPTVSLMGLFGMQAASVFNTTPTWNVGLNLAQPVLDFGKIQANINATDARQMQAFLDYQQIILEALEQMENSLANYIYEIQRNRSLTDAAQENQKALELAQEQYDNGFTPLLDVLVVQRNVLEAESAQAESDAKLRKDLVNIYTAAGGGWDY